MATIKDLRAMSPNLCKLLTIKKGVVKEIAFHLAVVGIMTREEEEKVIAFEQERKAAEYVVDWVWEYVESTRVVYRRAEAFRIMMSHTLKAAGHLHMSKYMAAHGL